MSTLQSHKRLSDENYKNWLKTAESLSILRIRIQDFIEKETETYHRSLLDKPALKGKTCEKQCDIKKNKQLCPLCDNWKNVLSANHTTKIVHWENCRPHLWPTNKWEVAKVYMSRGHKTHSTFAEFDIAAIFNLMSSCKYFQKIPKNYLRNVLEVRNSVMHSPDFKMSNADRDKHLDKVLEMARKLEPHVPKLKDLDKEIKQFNSILDKNFGQASQCEVDGKQEDIQNLKEIQTVLDRELQAMKEKFEDFHVNFEGNQDESGKKQSQGLLDFLDQNKDLLENLGPEVSKLKEMREKVEEHEQQINMLTGRVDNLEQVTHDPAFPGNPLRYKNHLYEFCRAKHWPEPKFTQDQEAEGYKGKVEVNGQTFSGTRVCNSIKTAHQEVAYIALQNLKLQDETTDESSSSLLISSSGTYFGKVIVDLNQEAASGKRCSKEEDAIESAYEELWKHLQVVMGPVQGQTFRSAILEYFDQKGFQKPAEQLVQNDDNTTICKLTLTGPFTFHDTDGSTKKKQAEQQAAEVAVKHLSKILNCGSISDTETNFKGVLKESLEKMGLSAPEYDTDDKEGLDGSSSEPSNLCITQASIKRPTDLQSESISTPSQLASCQSHESVRGPAPVSLNSQESSSSASQRKKAKIDCPGITYFGKVTVVLNREIASDGCCSNNEEASESAYKVLWQQLHTNAPTEGQPYRSAILDYFDKQGFQNPTETFVQNDDNTTICKLTLTGPFTFHDTDGSTKKKQAEQQAAEVAVKHLSKILNCGSISDTETNFKGVLKESLEKLGLSAPEYDTDDKEGLDGSSSEPSNLCIKQTTVKRPTDLQSESISTPSQLASCQSHESVCGPAPVSLNSQESSSSASQRKKAKIDCPEIDALLKVFNLKPPHVKVENIKYEENVKCTVEINLENFTFKNKKGFDTKKEAIRKTFLVFGSAMGIFEPSTDEKMSSAQVKQHFSQKSLPLPQEDVEGSAKPFCCSLKNITYSVVYEEQAPSESQATLRALQKALSSLSPLFNYPSLSGANSPEDVENQLSVMLKEADQKEAVISLHRPLVKTSVQLYFTDQTVKCTCKGNKKAARNHLSLRILGLLGENTDPDNPSVRNCLNQWFQQQNLPQPVFEDTEEAVGAKATFSVQFICCSPAWEDNWEKAKKKLVEELKLRFEFLND